MRNSKFLNTFAIFILLFLFSIFKLFDNVSVNFIFALIILQVIVIIKKCKFSFFSLKTICVNYPVLSLFYQYNYNMSYGLLEYTSMNIHYEKILMCIYIYNIIWLLIFEYTKILNYEKTKISTSEYQLNNSYTTVLCIIAIVSILIAFPRIPFIKFNVVGKRFDALLPGNAWNHLTVISLIILFPMIKKKSIVKGTFIFCIFWFLSHYERVDVVGMLCGLFILWFVRTNKKVNIKVLTKYGIPIFIVLVLMIVIGETRSNKSFEFSFKNIMNKILVQSTSADEAYILNLAVDYQESYGSLGPKLALEYVYNAVPLLDYENGTVNILKKTYRAYPGGEYILNLPYMAFGYIGILLFSIVEFLILVFIMKNKGILFLIWYEFILSTSFRIVWYGITYLEMGFIYIVPVLLLIVKIFKEPMKLNNNENDNSSNYKLSNTLEY